MRYIPTEKELRQKVKCVSVKVTGQYIAMIDERRRTSRKYDVSVVVPEKFTSADLKRATAKTLLEHPDMGDFVTMRTFERADNKVVPVKEPRQLSDFYSLRALDRMKRQREAEAKEESKARGNVDKGISGDTSEYNPRTGLPDLVEPELIS